MCCAEQSRGDLMVPPHRCTEREHRHRSVEAAEHVMYNFQAFVLTIDLAAPHHQPCSEHVTVDPPHPSLYLISLHHGASYFNSFLGSSLTMLIINCMKQRILVVLDEKDHKVRLS